MRSARVCEECAVKRKQHYLTETADAKARKLIYAKEWRLRNKEKDRESHRLWKQRNPERYKEICKKNGETSSTKPSNRFHKARNKAKERQIEFDITLELYSEIITYPCNYCNGSFGHVTKGTGLDRVDNSKGYVVGNIVSCCTACNRIKSDQFTSEETSAAVKAILAYRQKQLSPNPTES